MRSCVLVVICVAVVGACSKKPDPGPATKLVDQMPRVDSAAALAPATIELPRVVAFLGADGTITANDRLKAIPVDAAQLNSLVHEGNGDEDPPPPPEEEEDDGEEESGGTGTIGALEEGKMGKKELPKPETPEDQRRKALQHAGLGGVFDDEADVSSGFGFGSPSPKGPRPPELPERLGFLLGETLEAPLPDHLPQLLVVAAPGARAKALLDLLIENAALLAVAHQGTVRVLRIGFLKGGDIRWQPEWQPWMEVRVTTSGLQVEGVPGAPAELATLDAKALADAFTKERAARGITDRTDVDVLVAPDVDVQRLVDVLVALDGAGARIYSLGRLPAAGDPELAKRGKRVVTVQLRAIQAVGNLPKPVIVETLVAATPQVKACYETGLATKPELAGVVSTQFFISPNGTVASSNGAGVDPEVATCIADVIKGVTFPKPPGGAGTQVNAPFILRR